MNIRHMPGAQQDRRALLPAEIRTWGCVTRSREVGMDLVGGIVVRSEVDERNGPVAAAGTAQQ
ncbi:hypothetical protein [Streptomyces kebangsaanensis]|uniref:hypothetical protein n=1 Tax=Streptomyces kebangsaanensis TaxID=864058 RepID=UPI000AC7200C|nr:hypothetical protein [Streptomyces kebangsaanensis]